MLLREGWGARQVLKSLLWLRRENLNRGHIYVRPSGLHGLSLVDDLKAAALARMKAEGFEPAVVVETSPGNFQAWLKHGQVLDEATSTRAAKELAVRFGGDPGSADWRHFGRLAGFTNPKPSGGWNRDCSRSRGSLKPQGGSIPRPRTFSGQCGRRWSGTPANFKPRKGRASRSGAPAIGGIPRRCALWRRLSPGRHGLGQARRRVWSYRRRNQRHDPWCPYLSHKGGHRRQREYAERTAEKAVRQMRE